MKGYAFGLNGKRKKERKLLSYSELLV